MVRAVIAALLILVIAGLPAPGRAQQEDAVAFESKATNAILLDANSGEVLFEKSADEAIPPASMSKLVTQAVVFDLLKSGDIKEDTEFVVSEDAWRRGGSPSGSSTMYAKPNSKIRVIDLLKGAIVQSANDACIALAEGIAGSELAFTDRMMQKAKSLGMTQSSFGNATGLPDPKQRMSVRDLSKIASHIIKDYPDRYPLYSLSDFTWNEITQQNRNPLLKDYAGADGMKTGFTDESGYGLVGSVSRDGRRLIMVVAGLKSVVERRDEARKLLNWGFTQFKPIDLFEAGEVVGRARVWGGEGNWVDLSVDKDIVVGLTRKEQESVEVKLSYQGPLFAPVAPSAIVGSVRVLVRGRSIMEIPVRTASSVSAVDSMWKKAMDSALIMVFGG